MSSLKNTVKILYGLGNPSPEYDRTLHNIGKLYICHLAKVYKGDFQKGKGGEYALIRNSLGETVCLFKSQGFMNLSGVPYKSLIKSCGFIVHDDLDSKFSKFKIKNGGSPEGHNGLKSIIDSTGTKEFQRLKIGIGRPDSKDPDVIANYVTSTMQSSWLETYRQEIFPQIDAFLKTNKVL